AWTPSAGAASVRRSRWCSAGAGPAAASTLPCWKNRTSSAGNPTRWSAAPARNGVRPLLSPLLDGDAPAGADLRSKRGESKGLTPSYFRGLTQLSDQARQALEDWRSPRFSGTGWPGTKAPLISTWAARAGKNVLNTPSGRSLKPGGALST